MRECQAADPGKCLLFIDLLIQPAITEPLLLAGLGSPAPSVAYKLF